MARPSACAHVHGCAHACISLSKSSAPQRPCSPEREEHGPAARRQLLHGCCLQGCPLPERLTLPSTGGPAAPHPPAAPEAEDNRIALTYLLWEGSPVSGPELLQIEGSPGPPRPPHSYTCLPGLRVASAPQTPTQMRAEVSTGPSEHTCPRAPRQVIGAPAGGRRGRAGRAAGRRPSPSRGCPSQGTTAQRW